MTAAELLTDALTFEAPEHWPRDPEQARSLFYRLARVWGVYVALGDITLDEAYLMCRNAAESVQVSTAGAARWQAVMQFATWIVDQTVSRAAAAVAVADSNASRELRRVATAALSRGDNDRALRKAIADAAEQFAISPPVELLHQAYHESIATARRNARWIANRGTASQ